MNKRKLHSLFVHGMGRTPLSGWWLLSQLQSLGLNTSTFAYSTTFEDFAAIKNRLTLKILAIAAKENYILIGHSLGGVLLRDAINSLPLGTNLPQHLFLLGSPFQPPRLAKKFSDNPIYRLLAGDCGQLLGSNPRMEVIASPPVPTSSIAGIRGLPWKPCPFDGELNDGIVSVSEVTTSLITDQAQVSTIHTLLPLNKQIVEIILERLSLD